MHGVHLVVGFVEATRYKNGSIKLNTNDRKRASSNIHRPIYIVVGLPSAIGSNGLDDELQLLF